MQSKELDTHHLADGFSVTSYMEKLPTKMLLQRSISTNLHKSTNAIISSPKPVSKRFFNLPILNKNISTSSNSVNVDSIENSKIVIDPSKKIPFNDSNPLTSASSSSVLATVDATEREGKRGSEEKYAQDIPPVLVQAVKTIYNVFIKPGSELEINISYKSQQAIKKQILENQFSLDILKPIQKEIEDLLTHSMLYRFCEWRKLNGLRTLRRPIVTRRAESEMALDPNKSTENV